MHHHDGSYLPARPALLPAARHYVTDLTQRPGNFARSQRNRVEASRPGGLKNTAARAGSAVFPQVSGFLAGSHSESAPKPCSILSMPNSAASR